MKAEWVTITQAAKYLGVHPETMRRWDREGVLEAFRGPRNSKGHATRSYSMRDLTAFKKKRDKKNGI
jgi:DNA-binding transcriptional MerR regulator